MITMCFLLIEQLTHSLDPMVVFCGILKRFNGQRNFHWTEVYDCIILQGRGL